MPLMAARAQFVTKCFRMKRVPRVIGFSKSVN
jgi:hypothetical protein